MLKRVSGRENRFHKDTDHCISKALCDTHDNTLLVIESLRGIVSDRDKEKNSRRELHGWTFYELEQFLRYKAVLSGSMVLKVDPYCTSQRCPVCGKISKDHRHRDRHMYECSCGYAGTDDVTAALNIRELGIRWLGGDKEPSYRR